MSDSPHDDEIRLISAARETIQGLETILAHTSGRAREDLKQRIEDEVDVFLYKWYDSLDRESDPESWTPACERRNHHLCRVIVALLRREGAIEDDSLHRHGGRRGVSHDRFESRLGAVVEVEESTLSDALLRLSRAGVIREGRRWDNRAATALVADYEERLEKMFPTS